MYNRGRERAHPRWDRKNGVIMQWKALAFEAEIISKDLLNKKFLTEGLYKTYRAQMDRLKNRLERLEPNERSSMVEEKLALIEARLKVLNPTKRIQTNFEFFTRKITHYQDRLSLLKDRLLLFDNDYHNLATMQCKKKEIEREIALLEKELADAHNQRNALIRSSA